MLTGIVAVGDTITSGDVLYTVESQPVIALRGGLPAWRTMSASSDDGADIYQLEAALVALGYDPDGDVTVDAHWDRATTAMVERWQAGSNIDVTGEVTLGSVVFIAHDAQVASTSAVVGDELSNGDEVLALTGTQQQVVIEVPTELQAVVQPGLAVSLGATTDAVDGTVTRLRSDDSSGTVTIQALIVPTTPLDLEAGSTTKVRIEVSLATDQLIVPTDAILSLLDGTYAVEVVNADGGHDITPVTIVAVSGSKTAVTGDGLTDTTTILTPA